MLKECHTIMRENLTKFKTSDHEKTDILQFV